METIKIKLGEEVTLKAKDVLKGNKKLTERLKDEDCRWHVAGGSIVALSDLEDDDTLKVRGSQVGRSRLSYGPVRAEKQQSNRAQFMESSARDQVEFDVVVEEVRGDGGAAAAGADLSSQAANGLLPMDERQEEPSEKTPYGSDQENKPVAPTASMTAPDLSNVARQSEDAEPVGDAPAEEEKEEKKASKKSSKKK
jgi:hypothetical protein